MHLTFVVQMENISRWNFTGSDTNVINVEVGINFESTKNNIYLLDLGYV